MIPHSFLLLSLISLLLSACGQPGPLYLPEETPAVQPRPAAKAEPGKIRKVPPKPEYKEPKTDLQTDSY